MLCVVCVLCDMNWVGGEMYNGWGWIAIMFDGAGSKFLIKGV